MDAGFITPDDSRWLACLEQMPHDVYHLPEYLVFASRHEGGSPLAFFARDRDGCCLIPLLIRDIPGKLQVPTTWRDATSPYGYPSPLVTPTTPGSVQKFFESFTAAAREIGLVSIFLRLNPLLDLPMQSLASFGEVVRHGPTVVIDVANHQEESWVDIRPSHRRHIRKLLSLGFNATVDDWQYYEDFISLYGETMARVEASTFYLFSHEYFMDLKACLADRLHLCTVLSPQGEVASAGLFTRCGDILQYHLSGSEEKFYKLAPNKLMVDKIRRWGAASNARLFHLGGGLNAREDSLFEFKRGFSNSYKEFCSYRLIIDRNKYEHCLQSWYDNQPSNQDNQFFPKYRS